MLLHLLLLLLLRTHCSRLQRLLLHQQAHQELLLLLEITGRVPARLPLLLRLWWLLLLLARHQLRLLRWGYSAPRKRQLQCGRQGQPRWRCRLRRRGRRRLLMASCLRRLLRLLRLLGSCPPAHADWRRLRELRRRRRVQQLLDSLEIHQPAALSVEKREHLLLRAPQRRGQRRGGLPKPRGRAPRGRGLRLRLWLFP